MKNLFGSHSKSDDYHVGVDFGTRSIKLVELQLIKNKPHLTNYGEVFLDDAKEALDSFQGDYTVLLTTALGALLKQVKPKVKVVNVAIPAFNGLVMMVDFPQMKEEELAQSIQFEARKYIPTSLDDVNISWEIIQNDGKGPMKVLLVAAQKSDVQYYNSLFDHTGITVDVLELETFALVRATVGEESGRFLLVDIGAKTTNLVLAQNGSVLVNRNIDVGGIDLTSAIADNMQISLDRAREMKEAKRNFFNGPMPITFPSLGYTVKEVQRIITQTDDAVDGIILCGGGGKMEGLTNFFAQATNVPVRLGNPMSRVVISQDISAHVESSLGTSFTIALGLALGSIEKK